MLVMPYLNAKITLLDRVAEPDPDIANRIQHMCMYEGMFSEGMKVLSVA